ncbi:MAG: peptide ABC transporter ATP-binding protein, partial [Clostridia bacterium]|nr:peptide ABC transporter ATP-binding protein [Clostridia bacterium]
VMYAGKVAERGTADEIFYNPRHEYTKGLLRSIPNIEDETSGRLIPISGTPVDMLCLPKGCAFSPRCGRAMKVCLSQHPGEAWMNADHISACWVNVKEGACLESRPAVSPASKTGGEDESS